ncbi:MAG: exosortase C-terminal domain/associated protein EpsI, partial [Candidatus Thiodiazotropha sp.]
MNPSARTKGSLFTGIILFACLVIVTLVYSSSALSLYQGWIGENSLQSHGLLLLPLSAYLLAREWYVNRWNLQITYRPLYWIALLLASVVWLLTDIAKIQLLSQIMLILILWLTLVALFGLSRTWRMGFPILILLSATSGWSVLAQPLQEPTAYVVDQMLRLTGYVSFREGYMISIPEGVFEVGETCSGLRYQIAALTLALIYSFISDYSWFRGTVFLALASGVAFLSNAIRIYIVVLSGHYTNMTHSLLSDHIWLGWVVFALCFAGFMFLAQWFERRMPVVTGPREGAPRAPVHSAFAASLLVAVIVIGFASAGPLYRQIALAQPSTLSLNQDTFRLRDSGLVETSASQDWAPFWINPDVVVNTRFRLSDGPVDFFAAYYAYQNQGKEVVNGLNYAYPHSEWQTESSREVTISLSDGRKLPVNEERISRIMGSKRVLWSWYYIGGNVTSSPLQAKLLGMLSGLKGRSDAAVVVISTTGTG